MPVNRVWGMKILTTDIVALDGKYWPRLNPIESKLLFLHFVFWSRWLFPFSVYGFHPRLFSVTPTRGVRRGERGEASSTPHDHESLQSCCCCRKDLRFASPRTDSVLHTNNGGVFCFCRRLHHIALRARTGKVFYSPLPPALRPP
jgi:hypothetical protein